jgi:Family of unknown function (DUF5995)
MAIPAKNINEVISELDAIIQKSISENSKLGLFAALYKKVTENVRAGIANSRFQDGERMERLDVQFANRYLVAFQENATHQKVTNAWQVSFDAAKRNDVLILQHLLAGMNAHISLDLGIASAQVMKDKPIQDLEHDFNEINKLLGDMIDKVQAALSKSSPILFTVDWLAGRMDENLARFNLDLFRKRAWGIAVSLHVLDDSTQLIFIDKLDNQIKTENIFFTGMATNILSPITKLIAQWQNKHTAEVIKALNNI